MKSFKQFITEAAKKKPATREEMMALVERDCQPWLKAVGDLKAYRGMKAPSPEAKPVAEAPGMFKCTVRKDRKPLMSPDWLHDSMNAYFEKKMGAPMRTVALFTTANLDSAKNYQPTIFEIYPIGDFKYAWSPLVDDPTQRFYLQFDASEYGSSFDHGESAELEKIFSTWWNKNAKRFNIDETFNEFFGDHENIVEQFDIALGDDESDWARAMAAFIKESNLWKINTGIKTLLSSGEVNELMILCDNYYAIPSQQ